MDMSLKEKVLGACFAQHIRGVLATILPNIVFVSGGLPEKYGIKYGT